MTRPVEHDNEDMHLDGGRCSLASAWWDSSRRAEVVPMSQEQDFEVRTEVPNRLTCGYEPFGRP